MSEKNEFLKLYFRENTWVPPPYRFNKDDVDTLIEQSLLGDHNILSEAHLVISLYPYFKENFKKYFYYTAGFAILCIFATVGLFKTPLRRETLPSPIIGEYASVHEKKKTCTKYMELETDRASEDDSKNTCMKYMEMESNGCKDIDSVALVLSASELEIDRADEEYFLARRGRGGGVVGGVGNFLGNSSYLYSVSNPKQRTKPWKEFPKGLHTLHGSESRTKTKTFRRDSLKSSVDHSSNQSSLSFNRIYSLDFIHGNDSDVFVGRPGPIGDRDTLLVTDALSPVGDSADYRGYDYKNLLTTQELIWKSTILTEADKREGRKGIDDILNLLYDDWHELNELKKSKNARTEYLDIERKKLEKKIQFEEEQRDYHFDKTLNPDKVVSMIRREPIDRSHGTTTLNFQIYNPNFLSEEDKLIVGNNLSQYLDDFTKGIETKTNLPSKEDECSKIRDKVLEDCFDGNAARTKTATVVDDGFERRIWWLRR